MGGRRPPRAHDGARLRYQRGHVDERRRQSRWDAGGVRPARRHLPAPDIRQFVTGAAPDERPGVRHAAALQPRRQAHRHRQRPRRPVEHLDDRSRRQGRASRSRASGAGSSTAPTWSPDGAYIYARRHFVKERSLGAGEIWMYHTAGPGDGLQVTERNGWQKDAGEPDISPDGSTLFYSKDVTPGQTFEYNKDPNGTIYAILRRDLVTGRERRAVSVQGGSVAPQVSPDGKSLAYVRRVRLQSYLVRPRSRIRARSSGLWQHRQGSAGGLGDSRTLPAVCLDARRQGDRHLGRGKALARRRHERQGAADPVPGARRADAQRRRAHASRRAPARLPGQDAARCSCVSRRQARGLQRPGALVYAHAAIR